jgi:hypothetical protein
MDILALGIGRFRRFLLNLTSRLNCHLVKNTEKNNINTL